MPDPVSWDKKQKAEFIGWMASELHTALADRTNIEREWSDQIEQFHAPRRSGNDFPFPGASNEELPLTAMHFEPVLADFMQSIHAPRDLWTATDLSGEFTDNVNAITEYLTVVDRLFLRMRKVNERAFPDLILLGSAFYRNFWKFERKKVWGYDDDGSRVKKVQIINQPSVGHIPINDMIWPANAWDLDPDAEVAPARWCGHRFRLTSSQLRARAKGQEPFLPDYDKKFVDMVLDREEQQEEVVEKQIRSLDQLRPSFDRKVTLFRIEARFDVDGDGIDEDIQVIWYQPAGWILQATHNPWIHGKREYEVAQYIRTFSMLGMGIAKMDEMFQSVGSKMLNAQVDNILLANTRMYGFPIGMGLRPDEPIYPGKGWPLGPNEQIQEIRMSEVYPSIFQFMAQLQQMAESRTSVNELRTGNISGLPSRTPATTVLSLLREGNKKFDMVLGNLRSGALGTIGKRQLQMLAQRHQSGDTKWAQLAIDTLGQEDGQKIIRVLDMPVSVLEEGLGIEVTATSGQVNKEVEKQSLIGLAQFMGQAGPQLIQAAQLIGDQQLMQTTATALYNGGVELLKRLLEAFDIQNPSRYLPPPFQPGQQGVNGQQAPLSAVPPQQGQDQQAILSQLLGLGR